MSCWAENNFQNYETCDAPTVAGNFRFLLGLILAFIGLYIAMFSRFRETD